MASPTRRDLSFDDVAALASSALGSAAVHGEPLTGGGFAAVWRVDLADGRRTVLKEHHGELARVKRPALLHFDLWDGNVLAEDGHLTGLVDGERWLHGDPLMDLVSPALHGRIEDHDHPFAAGYYGGEHTFDGSERIRLALYRLHLYLLMTVEMPSRAMADPGREARLARLLADELAALR